MQSNLAVRPGGHAAVDLVETPNGDFTDVVLTYAAAGGNPSVQGVIRLAGVSGITMADITVQGAAARGNWLGVLTQPT